MGIFSKKSALDLYLEESTRRRLFTMFTDIENSPYSFLSHLTFSSKTSDSETLVVKLENSKLSQHFNEFMNVFLEEFNSKFPKGTESPRPQGDTVQLIDWPNYSIADQNQPFRVLRDPAFTNNSGETQPENFHFKYFSMYGFIDSTSIGKLYLLKGRNSETRFVELIDLNVDIRDELGASLWSICTSNKDFKSALFLRIRFRAGENVFDEVSIGFPRKIKAIEIGMLLSKFKL
jgi:hypothetical protein